MSGFYIPSYLDYSDGEADFKHLADSFTRRGPIRFKPISGYYTAVPADTDVVLRCDSTTDITIPADVFGEDNFATGAQVAVLNYSEKRVVIEPAAGVTINGPERKSIDRWRWGVLVKQNANLWLLSLGNMGGGDAKGVPLPPKITACFGISAGANILWDKPVDDGGSPITQYIIEESLDEKEWTGAAVAKPDDNSITINDLKVGTKYFFRVKAVNANGISDPSNVGEAVPSEEYNDAEGGTVSTYTKNGRVFRVHTFTTTGTLKINKAPNPFRVLAVAAGADGSFSGDSGNGGGGGKVVDTQATIPVGTISAVIGRTSNETSSFGDAVTAAGIGAAGGVGGFRITNPGNPGTASDITGVSVVYGGSGGTGGSCSGYQFPAQCGREGGDGGGGRGGGGCEGQGGSGSCDTPSTPGVNGLGGGGGGGGGTRGAGTACGPKPGGSGIVIVSYEIPAYNEATGGTETTYEKEGRTFKVHTFNAGGAFNVIKSNQPFRVVVVGGGGGSGRSWGCDVCCSDAGGGAPGYSYVSDTEILPVSAYVIQVGGGAGPAGVRQVAGSGGASSLVGAGVNRVAEGGGGGGNSGSGCCQDRGCAVSGKGGSTFTSDISGSTVTYAGGEGTPGGGCPAEGHAGTTGIVVVSYEIG